MQSHYSDILQIMSLLNSRVMSLLKWTNLERITTTENYARLVPVCVDQIKCVDFYLHIFHVYIFTLREEFREVAWHPIVVTCQHYALLCFAPFWVFLETCLPCVALPGPRDNSQCISIFAMCANVCVFACVPVCGCTPVFVTS